MKQLYIFVLLLFNASVNSNAQIVDSIVMKNFIERFSSGIGEDMTNITFVDTSGKEISLKQFSGKVLYINLWSTSCLPCITYYPKQQKLMNYINEIGLGDSVLFINICTENQNKDWKNILKKRNDNAINLFSKDTMIFKNWGMRTAWPSYVLIDKKGKCLGKKVPSPGEAFLGFILFAALKGTPAYKSYMVAINSNESLKKVEPNIDPQYAEYYIWLSKHKSTQK